MELIIDQEIRPFDNDQLVYKITSIKNSNLTFTFGDIVNIQWSNLTTDDQSEDNYYLSTDENLCETPFTPLIQILTKSVGVLSTLEITCKGRFLSEKYDSASTHQIVLEFKRVIFSKNDSIFTDQEKYANLRKVSGNRAYGEKDYDTAIKYYKIASSIVEDLPLRIDSIQFSCFNNMAACFMQMGAEKEALEVLKKVETVDPNNVKMLWRSGRALLNLGEYSESEKYLLKARDLDEESGVIKKDLVKVRMHLEQERAKKKDLYKKMMAGVGTLSPEGDQHKVQKDVLVVDKETESEVERVEATKQVNSFIEEKVDSEENESSETESEEQENIEYEKLETPVPDLLSGSPEKEYVPFEQPEKYDFEQFKEVEEEEVSEVPEDPKVPGENVEAEEKVEFEENAVEEKAVRNENLDEEEENLIPENTAEEPSTNILENTTFNFSEKKSQDSEIENDSVATEELLGETIETLDEKSDDDDEEQEQDKDIACGDAVVVEKPEIPEAQELQESVEPKNLETVQPIECSEDLSQERCEAVKEAVCEDYDEEGESSYALPPERDQFMHSNLEIIDENEALNEEEAEMEESEEEEEEEADDTKPVDIPIKNDDFFDEEPEEHEKTEVTSVPVQEEQPSTKSTFTPIQARNAEMNKTKVQEDKTKNFRNSQKSSSIKNNLNAEPNFNLVAIGSVVIILAAVAMRFFS